jgi:hypothetical protein
LPGMGHPVRRFKRRIPKPHMQRGFNSFYNMMELVMEYADGESLSLLFTPSVKIYDLRILQWQHNHEAC